MSASNHAQTKQAAGGASAPPAVAIVGAGIVGLSIALHLAQRGARVSVIDQREGVPPCTDGAFAMLIATQPDGPQAFNALYGRAIDAWHAFDADFEGALGVRWEGALMWAAEADAAARLDAQRVRLASWGSAVERLDADNFAAFCAGVETGPIAGGYGSLRHGVVDPARVWRAMRTRCVALGVAFETRAPLARIELRASRESALPRVAINGVDSDIVVIAAGEGTAALAASVGATVPYEVVSGSLAHSRPVPLRPLPALVGPQLSIKQNADGRIVAGLDYAPGAACDDTSAAYGEALLAAARARVPGLPPLELERVTHGRVPIPQDSQPIVGFLDGVANCYVAVMMSGVTMAPLMGRLIADEITSGGRDALLEPYAPSRFACA
ncbi:NAD(P)/FAD-dependent oxidoreductase [Burkholderia cenocepacia]|uniref:NAD(P)/FAD-dependent oxidoreductase n=1 Tax=Burkholderia cenocepacia TaxID=95486 RepID=UPI00287579EA|nr:FAD-binding oxidoreductase [Burkholderia cenocepacia]MDS0806598.1 FAD-binding oxidoreductase [Burkholderia cenocepacia]